MMNERDAQRRQWQYHLIALGWIIVVTLGYRIVEGVRSASVNVSWSRRRLH